MRGYAKSKIVSRRLIVLLVVLFVAAGLSTYPLWSAGESSVASGNPPKQDEPSVSLVAESSAQSETEPSASAQAARERFDSVEAGELVPADARPPDVFENELPLDARVDSFADLHSVLRRYQWLHGGWARKLSGGMVVVKGPHQIPKDIRVDPITLSPQSAQHYAEGDAMYVPYLDPSENELFRNQAEQGKSITLVKGSDGYLHIRR